MLEMREGDFEGHCLCGAVHVRVSGRHDPRPGACHCRICQRYAGGAFFCFPAEADAVTVTGDLVTYATSELIERSFCGVCGSHVLNREADSDIVDLIPGLFDAVLDQPLQSEIYVDRAMASVQLEGDHATATRAEWQEKHPGFDHVEDPAPGPDGAIEGRCLCGRVHVRLTDYDAAPGACHCRMCQRWSGALFLVFTARRPEIAGEPRVYVSSPLGERAFCPDCGSHVYMSGGPSVADEAKDFAPGLFDAAADWPLASEIYTDRAMRSVRLKGARRRETAAEWEAKYASVQGDTP